MNSEHIALVIVIVAVLAFFAFVVWCNSDK